MKISSLLITLTLIVATVALSGCASITNGRTQNVVIRSIPEGAVVKINGKEVGMSPVKVSLSRQDLYRVDIAKPGFAPAVELIVPSSEAYARRFFRWGLDEQLGASKVLVPDELNVELKAPTADLGTSDKYLQLVGQINRADAMLRTGELDAATHRFLIGQIVTAYCE